MAVLTAAEAPDEQRKRSVHAKMRQARKSRKHVISKHKACEILNDGVVRGREITDRQRRFMGARCTG